MDLKKEIAVNKKILVILILVSVLTVGMNVSYSLFQASVKLDNVVEIHTASEFPSSGGGGAVDDLIGKVDSEEDGIEGVDPETGLACIPGGDCKEYRYTGTTVKNYVQLKNKQTTGGEDTEELWRIIGIFTDSESGEKYMRIVRNEVLPAEMLPTNYVKNGTTYTIHGSSYYAYWNNKSGYNNDWATAGLQYYLNTEQDEGSNKGYMSYSSEETKGM